MPPGCGAGALDAGLLQSEALRERGDGGRLALVVAALAVDAAPVHGVLVRSRAAPVGVAEGGVVGLRERDGHAGLEAVAGSSDAEGACKAQVSQVRAEAVHLAVA